MQQPFITLEMLLRDEERINKAIRNKYPQLVTNGSMKPHEEKHYYACSDTRLKLITDAIYQKNSQGDTHYLTNQLTKVL